jgi:ubiquinone/menaquinone biosynthesis C-methylase UbiE
MTSVADILDAIPDAFLPQLLRGQLAEAEHLARYWWISQRVSGMRVLDAGCGIGHGSSLLAAAGAREVIGIDSESMLIEAAAGEVTEAVELRQMDAEHLAFPEGHFDIVVALGLLDQVADKQSVIDELLRVLSVDGDIVVSLAGKDGDAEIEAAHIATIMRASNCDVRVVYQRNWMTSAIFDEDLAASDDRRPLEHVTFRKLAAAAESSKVATLLWGSRGESPPAHPVCAITHAFAHKRWLARAAALEVRLAERVALEESLHQAKKERDELADRLIELEQRIARSN